GTLLPTAYGTACAYGNSYVEATGIEVTSSTDVTISIGDTSQISYNVSPSNASNKEASFSSSDTSIATVDSNGLITAIEDGTAVITVSSVYPVFTAEVNVTVEKIAVSSVTISPSTASVLQNETTSLTATVAPSDATYPEVTWTSSDQAIATVDSSGNVSAVGQGTATITATADGVSGTATVTVTGVKYSSGSTISDSSTGSSYTVTSDSTVTYEAPKNKNVKKVTIPNTVTIDGVTYDVTAIDGNAFKNCKKLKSVSIPSNIQTIGNNAFTNCSKLKKVTLPKNVTKIGKNTFKGCSSLSKIVIKSKNVSSIGKNAFKNISSNAVIDVPNNKIKAYKKLLKKAKLSSSVTVK
nr:Ig-like domain-containing protein [Butyrivibrio sp.]